MKVLLAARIAVDCAGRRRTAKGRPMFAEGTRERMTKTA
jgi:hypothetical protein